MQYHSRNYDDVDRTQSAVADALVKPRLSGSACDKPFGCEHILFKNQRPSAERGPSPFQGPSSYPQLCRWFADYLDGSQK